MSQHMKQLLRDSIIYTLFFLLLMASLLIPLSLITFWLLPLPFLILTVKHDWKATSLSGFISAIILVFVHPITLLFVLYAFLIGSLMGKSYRNPTTTGTEVLLMGIVISCVCSWIFFIVGEIYFDLIDELRKIWNQSPGKQMIDLETLMPPLLFILTVLPPLWTFFVGRYLLYKQGYPKKYLLLFRNWRLPRIFFYFFAILLLYQLFSEEESSTIIGIIFILQILFTIQGLSFVAFLLHVYRKNQLWLIPVSFSILIPLLSSVVLILGLIDTSFHLRERIKTKQK